jgi:hypothetical protein
VTLLFGVLIPVYDKIGELFDIPKDRRVVLLLDLVILTLVAALVNIIFRFYKQIKIQEELIESQRIDMDALTKKLGSLSFDLKKWRAIKYLLEKTDLVTNEHLKVSKLIIIDRIIGSDVSRTSFLKGTNNHPTKKPMTEYRFITTSDAAMDLAEVKIHDVLRDDNLRPEPIVKEKNYVVYAVKFPPIKHGGTCQLKIDILYRGAITENPDYIAYSTTQFKGGVEDLEVTIEFDKRPVTWGLNQPAEDLTFSPLDEELNLSKEPNSAGHYELIFKKSDPAGIYVIDFSLL